MLRKMLDGRAFRVLTVIDQWSRESGVKLDYTRPGKPTDNGLIESFNGRFRDEFLDTHE